MHARLATIYDLPALRALMDAAIGDLQSAFLTPGQIAASRKLMGLDTVLIRDRTYYLIETKGRIAGSGGWSRRATLYGGDHSPGRDPALLDPTRDAARIRAMYTAPEFARQGVGRRILALCEQAASEAGFRRVELAATLAGAQLYAAQGYQATEHFEDMRGGIPVPLIRMTKDLRPNDD